MSGNGRRTGIGQGTTWWKAPIQKAPAVRKAMILVSQEWLSVSSRADRSYAPRISAAGIGRLPVMPRKSPSVRVIWVSVRWLRLSEQNFQRISGAPAGFKLPRFAEAG